LPQRLGEESIHKGAHGREHAKTSLNPSSADRPFRNVHLGLSSSDADALEETLGVRTVRDLADNKYVRRAQAIVNMAHAKE
jgi:hypothetical protein